MSDSFTRFLIGVIVFTCIGCSAISSTNDSPSQPETEDDNDAIIGENPLAKFNAQAAADYSDALNGSAVLVMHDGEILFEEYQNGATSETPTHIFSATKGFWAPVVAKFIQQGYLTGFDQKVSDVLTEWKGTAKANITIRQTMQLSTGLENDIDELQGLGASAPDLYSYAVNETSLSRAPGSIFRYGPVNYYVIGALIQRLIENHNLPYTDPLDFLNKVFFAEIGIEYADWARDQNGNPHIPNGAFITPRNLIKWAQFIHLRCHWNGKAMVDPQLVDQFFQPSERNPGHGLFYWLNNKEGFSLLPQQTSPAGSDGGFMYYGGREEIIGILGAGKNRVYIVPSENLVIVRQTLGDEGDFIDDEFLSLFFNE